jgi:hypothetical protein
LIFFKTRASSLDFGIGVVSACKPPQTLAVEPFVADFGLQIDPLRPSPAPPERALAVKIFDIAVIYLL